MKDTKGFTLVELAIVLVIIGIILGAVIKGQELIFNAKVKRLQSQVKEIMAAVYTYYDKYGYFPGDDPAAQRWTGAPSGNGDGIISGGYCDTATEESCYLWRHLRYANIITGDPADANPPSLTPKHAWGGQIHVFLGTYTVGGVSRNSLWMAFRNLPGGAADALDRALDDGKCNSGSLAAYSGTCDSTGNYKDDTTYEVWLSW